MYFSLARDTFITNDGFEHPKMKHFTLVDGKRQPQCSYFWYRLELYQNS